MPADGIELFAKVRSTRPPRPGHAASTRDGRTWVELAEGEFGIAPGQACVLYADDGDDARVLGGGFIAALRARRRGRGHAERGSPPAPAISGQYAGTYPRRIRAAFSLRDFFETCSGAPYGGGFENRSAADIWVREHRKRRKRHQVTAGVEFPDGLSGTGFAVGG